MVIAVHARLSIIETRLDEIITRLDELNNPSDIARRCTDDPLTQSLTRSVERTRGWIARSSDPESTRWR